MANPVTHALFALALYGTVAGLLAQASMPIVAFLAALVSLLPDAEIGADRGRSPLGHSLGSAGFTLLAAVSTLAMAVLAGALSPPLSIALLGAAGLGLGSHLLLDAFSGPGIWTFPRAGAWRRIRLGTPRNSSGRLDLIVSGLSLAALLMLTLIR